MIFTPNSTFDVCEYQGNFYTREVTENSYTVYMDYVHSTHTTYKEADAEVDRRTAEYNANPANWGF